MPKKRRKSNKRKGNRNLIIGIIIVVVIVAIIFIILNNKGSEEKATAKEENDVLISRESFAFITPFYLNEKSYDMVYCNRDIECKSLNGVVIQCPKVDQLTLRFKVYNLDSLAFVSCKVTDGEKEYTQQHFAFYPAGKIAELSLQNIAYNEKHNFEICCQYDDGKIKSNEFCLPPITVKSICS